MEIISGVEIKDLSLYIKQKKILVVSDFHIGFEEALNKQGILIPRLRFEEVTERLKDILKGIELKKIIILGDLKHEFGTISETEWRNTIKMLDLLSGFCKDIILLQGNHDNILGPIAAKRNIKIKKTFKSGDFFFCHGDVIPKNISEAKIIVIGHEHPAIGLKKDSRVEVFKCFLRGSWNGKTLIVMPSFNLVTEGTDVLKENMLSPFLHQDISNFNAFIISETIYDFGRLKNLKDL